MRRALIYLALATLAGQRYAAAQPSWNHIQYIGGTLQVKASRFDWNTTLKLTADTVEIEVAPATVFTPKKAVHIKFSQLVSLSGNAAAWERVAAVDGAQLPAKHPTLFGVLEDYGFIGLVYEADGGKRGAVLLESPLAGSIMRYLSKVTGKTVENAP
jgi:hypothetical protein